MMDYADQMLLKYVYDPGAQHAGLTPEEFLATYEDAE